MFRDVAATGVAAWTPSSNTLPPTIPQEGAGDSMVVPNLRMINVTCL